MAFSGQSALTRQTLLVPETATKEKEKVEELNLSRFFRCLSDVNFVFSIFAYASHVSCSVRVVRGQAGAFMGHSNLLRRRIDGLE